jgi:hypothetical protein
MFDVIAWLWHGDTEPAMARLRDWPAWSRSAISAVEELEIREPAARCCSSCDLRARVGVHHVRDGAVAGDRLVQGSSSSAKRAEGLAAGDLAVWQPGQVVVDRQAKCTMEIAPATRQ